MPKVFFKDSGMRNIALNRLVDFRDREDQGQLIENYVFNRLSEMYDKDSIRFWRTTGSKKFLEYHPDFQFRVISHDIHSGCTWVLNL